MLKNTALFISCIFAGIALCAQPSKQFKTALFIGNSYTSVNNLPQLVATLAASAGDSLVFDANDSDGFTLANHNNNYWTKLKIAQGWDYVILQEQSQLPALSSARVSNEVYPYASALNAYIKSINTCTITQFYMTWGRKYGDSSNCAQYAAVCTYNGMDSLLALRYNSMADMNGSELSPVGAVWHYIRSNFPLIELYQGDGSRPSAAGSYVAACTFYTTIFRADPTRITNNFSVDALQASVIRNAVKMVVYKQMNKWNIGIGTIKAAFNWEYLEPEIYGLTKVRFFSVTDSATTYKWYFDDGDSAMTRTAIHPYNIQGKELTVNPKLIVYGCNNDTISKEIKLVKIYNSIQNSGANQQHFKSYPNPVLNQLTLLSSAGYNLYRHSIIIRDLSGSIVIKYLVQTNCNEIKPGIDLPAGVYFLLLMDEENNLVHREKIVVIH